VNPPDLAQLFVRMGQQPGTLVADRVRQKHLGGEAGG
jgi:hypothetical protein